MPEPSERLLCHYRYDALDRLVSHALPALSERWRFYCNDRLATEVQGTIKLSVFQHAEQLLAQQCRKGDTLDALLLATDQKRSVLEVVNADLPKAVAYAPYGHSPVESGLNSLPGFNGERPDLMTGHYLLGNGYRAFNPLLMRFNSPDSFSPFGKGGVNGYAYCSGDPINNSDPTGHAIDPSRFKTLVSGWVAKAKANLSLQIGEEIIREYPVSLASIERLRIATHGRHVFASRGPGRLSSASQTIHEGEGIVVHHYSSGISRRRFVDPMPYQERFDSTPGLELDAILRQPGHPQYNAVRGVFQQNSEINIHNHLSVAHPHLSNVDHFPDPNLIWARIDSGLSGSIPGVMHSMLSREIRNVEIPYVSRAQLTQRYPRFFNPRGHRGRRFG